MGLKQDVKSGKVPLDVAIRRAGGRDSRKLYSDSIRAWLRRRKKRGGGPGPSGFSMEDNARRKRATDHRAR